MVRALKNCQTASARPFSLSRLVFPNIVSRAHRSKFTAADSRIDVYRRLVSRAEKIPLLCVYFTISIQTLFPPARARAFANLSARAAGYLHLYMQCAQDRDCHLRGFSIRPRSSSRVAMYYRYGMFCFQRTSTSTRSWWTGSRYSSRFWTIVPR